VSADPHDVLDWSERLVTPALPKGPTYSSADTVRFPREDDPPGAPTLQSELTGGPTLPLRGDTDQPGSAANFKTAEAVRALISVNRQMLARLEQIETRAQTDPRITTVVAEGAALDARVAQVEAVQRTLTQVVDGWRHQYWPLIAFSALNTAGLLVLGVAIVVLR
jgi:hypothetical protein